ncbi:MAG: hypothetical protein RL421_957, partial [Actinomycetota bacterium]
MKRVVIDFSEMGESYPEVGLNRTYPLVLEIARTLLSSIATLGLSRNEDLSMSLFSWKLHGTGTSIAPGEVVSTDERLSWPRTIGVGLQHIAAMFGATFLVPILTGLPPTLEQTREFIEDPSTDAHEKLVHKLLQSPHYGEHWAQQWLDLVRYSDSEGFKIDRIRPEAWKYRNWVIRSLNEDMPYNQFVQWQIAGDELAPEVRDARIATGFLRLAPEESNGADYTLIRQDILNDVTDVTSQAVLGITMGCARCHHHKFDPIRQEEYFQFQAFFSGILYPDAISLPMAPSLSVMAKTVEEKARPIREEISQMMKGHEKDLFEEIVVALDPETQVALKTTPENRTVTQTQLAILASKQIERRRTKLYRRLNTEQRAVYDKKMENLKSIEKEKPS